MTNSTPPRTNQTTIENISPFLLLRHLPPLPAAPSHPTNANTTRKLSDPPQEHELSYSQRRMVKDAHWDIRVYDVGWRRNWALVGGWEGEWGWGWGWGCDADEEERGLCESDGARCVSSRERFGVALPVLDEPQQPRIAHGEPRER